MRRPPQDQHRVRDVGRVAGAVDVCQGQAGSRVRQAGLAAHHRQRVEPVDHTVTVGVPGQPDGSDEDIEA